MNHLTAIPLGVVSINYLAPNAGCVRSHVWSNHTLSFADPQSVTVNAVAQSLPNVVRDSFSAMYRKDDGSVALKISHVEKARNRRVVRIDFEKVAADPFTPALNQKFTGSVYVVLDAPVTGYTNTELGYYITALADWLKAGTNAAKVLGGES